MKLSSERTGVPSQQISLEQKVAFLRDIDNYPHPTSNVKTIKTHMSWVFLTDQFVYKLKIPFHYDHMRLLTSKARHQNCVQEVRLNRRLSEEIYLGLVPLSVDSDGELTLGGGKQPVDWLVKMKRLPAANMLDEWMKSNERLSKEKLKPVAELLSQFYEEAEPVSMSLNEYRQKLASELTKCCDELRSPEFDLPIKKVSDICERQRAFIETKTTVLENRLSNGKIIEGHGDLKPDHICLSPPAVIDCLEFDENLRNLDVLDDLAFLSLECDRLGHPWVGDFFISYYAKQSKDPVVKELLGFYKSYRSIIRALLSIRHLREEQYQGNPKWRRVTETYLKLADSYIR